MCPNKKTTSRRRTRRTARTNQASITIEEAVETEITLAVDSEEATTNDETTTMVSDHHAEQGQDPKADSIRIDPTDRPEDHDRTLVARTW